MGKVWIVLTEASGRIYPPLPFAYPSRGAAVSAVVDLLTSEGVDPLKLEAGPRGELRIADLLIAPLDMADETGDGPF